MQILSLRAHDRQVGDGHWLTEPMIVQGGAGLTATGVTDHAITAGVVPALGLKSVSPGGSLTRDLQDHLLRFRTLLRRPVS